MLSKNEFTEFYKKYKRFPNGLYCNPDKVLNSKQLESKYKKYLISGEKRLDRFSKQSKKQSKKPKIKIDNKWIETREKVFIRDKETCQYYKSLNLNDQFKAQKILEENSHLLDLDPAHIFGKGSYPKLKYDTDNIVLLFRFFHSRIDNYLHPVTGKSITKEERNNIWISIIGIEKWNSLLNKIKNNL